MPRADGSEIDGSSGTGSWCCRMLAVLLFNIAKINPQLRRGLGDNFSLLAVKRKPHRNNIDKSSSVVLVECDKITLSWRNDVHNTKFRWKLGNYRCGRVIHVCRHLVLRAHDRTITIGRSPHESPYPYVKTLLIGWAREINILVHQFCISEVRESFVFYSFMCNCHRWG